MKPFPVRVQLFNESSVQVSFSGHFRDSETETDSHWALWRGLSFLFPDFIRKNKMHTTESLFYFLKMRLAGSGQLCFLIFRTFCKSRFTENEQSNYQEDNLISVQYD